MKKVRFTPLWMSYAGVLVALQIVLGSLVQIALVGKQMNLGFLPIAVAGYMLGPIGGMLVAGLGDVLGTLIFGTGAYFPGFTVTALIVGFLYGWMMSPHYQKWITNSLRNRYAEFTLRGLLGAALAAVVYIFLNSYWVTYFVPKGYWVLLVGRLPFNLLEIPIFTILIALTCAALDRLPMSLLPEEIRELRHHKAEQAAENHTKA